MVEKSDRDCLSAQRFTFSSNTLKFSCARQPARSGKTLFHPLESSACFALSITCLVGIAKRLEGGVVRLVRRAL